MLEFPTDSRFLDLDLDTEQSAEFPLKLAEGQFRRCTIDALISQAVLSASQSYLLRNPYWIQLEEEDLQMLVDLFYGFSRCAFRWDNTGQIALLAGSRCIGGGGVLFELTSEVFITPSNLDTGSLLPNTAYTLYIGLDNQQEVLLRFTLSNDAPSSLFSSCPIGVVRTDASGNFVEFDFSAGRLLWRDLEWKTCSYTTSPTSLSFDESLENCFPGFIQVHANTAALANIKIFSLGMPSTWANVPYVSGSIYLFRGQSAYFRSNTSSTLYAKHEYTEIWGGVL